MAEGAPLKYIDIKRMMSQFGQGAIDKSLALTGILPGQGQIPPASAEFLASNRNPFPNALGLPQQAFTGESLAGTLGQVGEQAIVRPGTEGIDARQAQGFFANNLRNRMQANGL